MCVVLCNEQLSSDWTLGCTSWVSMPKMCGLPFHDELLKALVDLGDVEFTFTGDFNAGHEPSSCLSLYQGSSFYHHNHPQCSGNLSQTIRPLSNNELMMSVCTFSITVQWQRLQQRGRSVSLQMSGLWITPSSFINDLRMAHI